MLPASVKKVLLRTEAQLARNRLQVTDGGHAVPVHHVLRHADGIGVVDADLAHQPHIIFILQALVYKIVERPPLRYIRGIQTHDGRQDGTVPVVH